MFAVIVAEILLSSHIFFTREKQKKPQQSMGSKWGLHFSKVILLLIPPEKRPSVHPFYTSFDRFAGNQNVLCYNPRHNILLP